MKDVLIIENVEYYSISDIRKWLFKDLTLEEIHDLIQSNKLKGKLINNSWFFSAENLERHFQECENENYHLAFSKVALKNINFEGRVLDIGGGGEGVIGQFKGNQVISIDRNKGELLEAKELGDTESLKIIMDATNLLFLDESFNNITAFFSLMYMNHEVHNDVFKEVYRVLKEGGKFILWDPVIPLNSARTDTLFIIFLEIILDEQKVIHTGYGTKWNKKQDIDYYINIGKDAGFNVINRERVGKHFCLTLSK